MWGSFYLQRADTQLFESLSPLLKFSQQVQQLMAGL